MSQTQDEIDAAFGDDPFDMAFAEPKPESNEPKSVADVAEYINTHGYWLRFRHPPGHYIYPEGCWTVYTARRMEGHTIAGDFIRHFDRLQLEEMQAALDRGFMEDFMSLLHGEGVKYGPIRVGKPPLDPFGKPIVEINNGDYGSLKSECEWIENYDKVFIQYVGKDENWPNGCWVIESENEPQYCDPDQISYIAHELLAMPKKGKPRRNVFNRKSKRENTLDAWSKIIMGDRFIDEVDSAFSGVDPLTEPGQTLIPAYQNPDGINDFDAAFM